MTLPRRHLAPLTLALALAVPAAARADLFSPGELSKAHAAYEGLQNCTKCHTAGKQLTPEACLACHGEVKALMGRGKGLHGRLPQGEACEKCHHEHQGRDFALVDWGKDGRKGFDHARTGYELRGKHRRADCEKCHDHRLVSDAGVLALLEKHPGKKSWLGAPAACAACHADEHRGQLGNDCQRCHGEDAWKPAKGFVHAKAKYPLEGKHARVECAKCHKPEQDPEQRKPAPGQVAFANATAFVKYTGLQFGNCTDCHKDPHQGRFGERCSSCHTVADWKKLSGAAAERAFHDKTRYPLRGEHVEVKCTACHGPFPGQKAVFKNMAFGRCSDCHFDAHEGQLARLALAGPLPANATLEGGRKGKKGKAQPVIASAPPVAGPDCEACHTVNGFLPVKFDVADHAKLEYRLEGAHRAVACALCHPKDPRLERRVPEAMKKELARRKRPLKVSQALLAIPKAGDCRTCHRDPHGGQFDARLTAAATVAGAGTGCAACHVLESFKKVRFDHNKESRFPLDGKHTNAACGSCHKTGPDGAIKYKPLPLTCAGCHPDIHQGQLAVKGQTDCSRCHVSAGWKDQNLKFRHTAQFSRFVLDGKHEKVDCAKCHGLVKVAGVETRRYKPVPVACQACHDDFHKGAFRGFSLPASMQAPGAAAPAPAGKGARPPPAPDLSVRTARADAAPASTETVCASCHSTASWQAQGFDHARTGFPLEGAHQRAACGGCHVDRTFKAPVPRACAACHADVHAGRLGGRCERCHDATSWRATRFDADAHRRSDFPLTGKHAFTACDQCHANRRDLGFTRATRECLGCHQAEFDRAKAGGALVDHAVPGFPVACQRCHSTWGFSPSGLAGHDACFEISRGRHAGVKCRACHTSVPPGVDVTKPLTCLTDTTKCQSCHSCAEHEQVAGFSCTERKCYECHKFSTGGAGLRLPASGTRGVRR
ncbi:MAG: hypothetical protein U0229_02855 [Anaeromyxobacter sp.]